MANHDNYVIQGSSLDAIANEVKILSDTSDKMTVDEITSNIAQVNSDVNSQADIIAQIQTALEGKAAGSGSGTEVNRILNEYGSGKLEHKILNYTEDSFRCYSAFVNANFEEVNITQAKTIMECCFENCWNLEKVVLNSVERIMSFAFIGCEKLSTVVITTPSVPLLDDVNAFDGTPIINYGGSIYVPQNMVDTYMNDTNWSLFDIQSIESLGGEV